MTYFRVIIVIIALSVACGYEYDYDLEYDWSRSRSSSPPKKEEVVPKAQVIDPKGQAVVGNPKLPDGSYKYRFPSSTTTTPKPTPKTKTLTVTRTTTSTTTTPRMTTRTTTASSTTTTTVYPSYKRPMEKFLKAAYDLIPEDDRKKFGFLTIDEIHEIREAERELIFQSLKKILQGDHLSQKVEENILGGFSKMLDLENSNSTHIDTRAAEVVNTTVKPEVMETTEPPALDVEEEYVNMTMPSTAVSVPRNVKELTEADLRTAKVTGEI
jgi:hypothetical protein